jgi:hypothetical protein
MLILIRHETVPPFLLLCVRHKTGPLLLRALTRREVTPQLFHVLARGKNELFAQESRAQVRGRNCRGDGGPCFARKSFPGLLDDLEAA